MKDQYVGDINDFEKYSILRGLSEAGRLPLVVCWMLTEPDDTGQGARTDYLQDVPRFRHLDPHVFDRLKSVVDSGNRTTAAVEAAGVLEGATFVQDVLEDGKASRSSLFQGLQREAQAPSLLFFDPDIGLANKRIRKGNRRSPMYVFYDELADAFEHGNSLVVYQHFPYKQRLPYLKRTFEKLRAACNPPTLLALWSARVAFFVIAHDESAPALVDAAEDFAARWAPLITFTREEELASTGERVREISLSVSGYPPTKNEAKSLLSAGHSQFPRVLALLEAAAASLAEGAESFGIRRLGLELVVCGPADAPSDATNSLGGIGDVLQEKKRRGSLGHLGPLANVSLFTDDRQIRRVNYREERAEEASYRLRLWPLDGNGS